MWSDTSKIDVPVVPLAVIDGNASATKTSRRGGRRSREQRREKYLRKLVSMATRWQQLAQGALRRDRAKLRDDVQASWSRLTAAREKIRGAVWRAWTSRTLKISGPLNDYGYEKIRGQRLEPLSHRDMFVLRRAAARAKYLPDLGYLTYRHVNDWLRVEMPGESEDESSPYWCWTHKAEEAEEAEYTSDEDDCSEIASDEDAPADEAEIEVLRWLNCRGEICRCSGTHEVVQRMRDKLPPGSEILPRRT